MAGGVEAPGHFKLGPLVREHQDAMVTTAALLAAAGVMEDENGNHETVLLILFGVQAIADLLAHDTGKDHEELRDAIVERGRELGLVEAESLQA